MIADPERPAAEARALRFGSAAEEQAFRDAVIGGGRQQVRYSALFAATLVVIFFFFDVSYGMTALHSAALRGYWLVLIGNFVAWTFSDRYVRLSQPLGAATIVLFCLGWLVNLESSFYELVQVLIFNFFFCGMLFRTAVRAGLFPLAFHLYLVTRPGSPDLVRVDLVITLVSIYGLIAMASYQREVLSRRLFIQEADEKSKLVKRLEEDRHHLGWLRNLATFLRHEVRQPIAQIQTSLDLIEMSAGEGEPRLKAHLRTAATGTQQVWSLVERASLATDSEAFVRESRPRFVDLAALLKRVVDDHAATTSGNSLRLAASAARPMVRADPSLVTEAISNLLSNASSFSTAGSEISVGLRAEDGLATIAVTNEGAAIDGEPERFFELFASTRAATDSAHHGIGLYLVRLIAEHFGGGASLRNRVDRAGVEARIWLPIAAPAPRSTYSPWPAPTGSPRSPD